jgi:Phage tail assembly chaperone protein
MGASGETMNNEQAAKAILHVHYRATDGEIFGFENGKIPSSQQGCEILSIEIDHGQPLHIDPKVTKVDHANRTIIEKTAAEKMAALLPTATEVSRAVIVELQATDAYMVPDRPLGDAVRAQWVVYRKALRDLSKGNPSIATMINTFPKRPGGTDAAADLRARLLAATSQPATTNEATSGA